MFASVYMSVCLYVCALAADFKNVPAVCCFGFIPIRQKLTKEDVFGYSCSKIRLKNRERSVSQFLMLKNKDLNVCVEFYSRIILDCDDKV